MSKIDHDGDKNHILGLWPTLCVGILKHQVFLRLRLWWKPHKSTQEAKNKQLQPKRRSSVVSRAPQKIGDEDGLHQTGNHHSQTERQEHIWSSDEKKL